jgi:probable H4MPT-linked C1 transfer pathway protein
MHPPNRLWTTSAAEGCGDRQPGKPAAFSGSDHVELGHGRLFPQTASSAAARLLAFDIGGANLKAADGLEWTATLAFPLWQRWRELPAALEQLILTRQPDRVVATMTGEICDCYPSRTAGVSHIVASLVAATQAARVSPPEIYLIDGRLVPPAEAIAAWRLAAASNWHVLARLAAAVVLDARAVLLDIGSTTTDIVPLDRGRVAATASNDTDRMLASELVYTGVERTAVAAIVRHLPHRGQRRPVASELFAESRDAWLTLGGLRENPAATDAADGGPATAGAARVRLARMMLLDPDSFTADDAVAAAECIAARQATLVARALRQVARAAGWRPDTIVLSGHGDQLARRAVAMTDWQPEICSLADAIGPAAARSAPAYALACLARGALR